MDRIVIFQNKIRKAETTSCVCDPGESGLKVACSYRLLALRR